MLIDLVLAGDNAIVVGSIAAGVARERQRVVLLAGVGIALVLRIVFALVATRLLDVPGLQFVGGLLLCWVVWSMWRDTRRKARDSVQVPERPRTVGAAIWSVAIADVSMSLDNVLGVAAAARDHPLMLVIGLLFSVALMGAAAGVVARVIERHRWIGYAGLAVIAWVAARMLYEGWAAPGTGLSQLLG